MERQKKNKIKFYAFGVLSLLFVIFIFSNSLKNGEDSAKHSGFILAQIKALLSFTGFTEDQLHFLIRKVAHFSEFAILGVFLVITFNFGNRAEIIKKNNFRAPFIGLCVAVTDEFIQAFVPSRGSMVQDILIDFAGFIFGFLIIEIIIYLIKRRKFKKGWINEM